MKFYLAGGAIRDMLSGNMPHEYDFVFSGTANEFISRNPNARKAGTAFEICVLDGIEYAPIRGRNIEEDLYLRDLTINAVALSEDGRLHSHPNTFTDINKKILRPVSSTSLHNDPIRVFRTARFTATMPEYSLHADTISQMKDVAQSSAFQEQIAERVGLELLKALSGKTPGNFITSLTTAHSLKYWFEELVNMSEIPAGPPKYHSENCLQHTADVMNKCSENSIACYMALCHDLGKKLTLKEKLPRHIGHEKRGEEQALNLGKRLKLPNKYIKSGAIAACEHMKGGQYPSLRSGTKVDLLMRLHTADLLEPFFIMVKADSGNDYLSLAKMHLNAILSVRLPDHLQNLGPESGVILRELRCKTLSSLLSN